MAESWFARWTKSEVDVNLPFYRVLLAGKDFSSTHGAIGPRKGHLRDSRNPTKEADFFARAFSLKRDCVTTAEGTITAERTDGESTARTQNAPERSQLQIF